MTRSPSATVAETFAAVERLLPQIDRGDVAALFALYDLTSPRVLGLVSGVLGPGDSSHQVTLEVYETVWSGEAIIASLPCLLDLAHGRAVARKRRDEAARVPYPRLSSTRPARTFPPDKEWMPDLADDERLVLAEVYLRGRTATEADARLGWTPGTSTTTLHRAMLHLAELHNLKSKTVMA